MLDLIMSSALAQEAAKTVAPTSAQPPAFGSFLPLILIFFVFYFLMIRPQQKKIKEEQALLASLNKGDEVYTKSGIIGTINGLTDRVVTLEVAEGVRIKVLRGQIAGFTKKLFETKATPGNDEKTK